MSAGSTDMSIRPLTPAIGAVIEGVNLRHDLDKTTLDRIHQALVTHKVIFFPRQSISPEQQRSFALHFGELHIHPIMPSIKEAAGIIELAPTTDNPPGTDIWHTDVTFIKKPPMGAVLVAKVLPPCGGDTCWSSNIAAYNALSEPFRCFLDGLTALHDFKHAFKLEDAHGDEQKLSQATEKNPPVVHPVVRVHPVTGQKGLFVNRAFTSRIVELSKLESDTVLQYLFLHCTKPEFTVRWKWSVGDVAFWDNRSTQHYALNDYLPLGRIMHRAAILGDEPRGPVPA
ncbi:hypothetical protein RvY_08325 [Ramazzottius varieornatus]|uniref:TauD/TfdA-like domain-containing protein n=1 Tax=Ramazzottius varieornatus TaxID=947166 RepID=A0A1D1V5J0_RAMVA|nr:hypothetical protein RvY_08325 [Ramazzottius varieornatus]